LSNKSSLSLDDIDSTLKSDASNPSTPPSPDAMQSKIDDLKSEVSSGKFTSDRADEFKNAFSGGAVAPPPGC
jgi:hypothetical protein